MDFADFSPYTLVANTDYSPTNESFSYPDTFDKAYLADAYTAQPDYSLDSFFDIPVTSIEHQASKLTASPKSQMAFSTPLPATGVPYQPTFDPAPFGSIDQFPPSGFSFDPTTTESFETRTSSPTPSLCGDGPQPQPISPSLSLRSLKRESPDSPTLEPTEPPPKRPQRKRGRPRLGRSNTCESGSSASSLSQSAKARPSYRLPHNQVERKYREGLNSELDRLRRAVPTLPQSEEGGAMGQPKPSKAVVLAGAIEYIKKLERERDAAVAQCERLRNANAAANAERLGFSRWNKSEEVDFGLQRVQRIS